MFALPTHRDYMEEEQTFIGWESVQHEKINLVQTITTTNYLLKYAEYFLISNHRNYTLYQAKT